MARIPLLLISIFTLSVHYLNAQQDSSLQLDNVIITANLAVQQQKESGRNIIAINGNTFRQLPVHSVDELLRYLPGIEIQQRGPQGAQSDITIRGGTFQQVLVIIDGIKLNDPLTGHFSMYVPIHPAEIERVEILKGAASAIWGSEAVGGVVHIITRAFSGKQQNSTTRARLQTGEYGLINGDAFFSRSDEKSYFSAGILNNNARGPVLRGTRNRFNLHTTGLSYSRMMADNWQLRLRASADFRSFNAQNFYTSFASDTAREKVNSGWLQAGLQKKTSRGSFQADIAYKKLRDQYWFRPAAVPNDNRSGLFLAQAFYSGRADKKNQYTAGAQLIRKTIRSNDRGNHGLWHGAVYGIVRHKLNGNFFLNESLRLDWDESYGWVLVPQVSMAWSPGRLTLRMAGGRSFRDADFTERYNNYNKVQVTSGRIGNPDLGAEQSWNAEIGADYQFNSRFRISAGVFTRDYADLIDWVNTPYAEMPRKENLVPGGSYALASNVEKIRTSGFELDLVYRQPTGPRSNLLAVGGFTVLDSKNDDPVPSLYISSHATLLFNYSLAWTIRSFSIAVTGLYKERDPQKSAALNTELSTAVFLLNSRLSWQFSGNRGKLYAQADNLLNTRFSDLLGARMPGRWLSAGIEIALCP
ncbi:MAG: TonB-dependent receptor [Chitinophagaceae bacterium]|nr:TonB-dependent receptor [Chitinophagaceae bacterium]